MSRLIDADKFKKLYESYARLDTTIRVKDILEDLDDMPTIEPSAQPETKKGEWIEISPTNHTYKCSECGRLLVNVADGRNNVSKHYPYCHCGADMRGEKE